MKSYQDQTREHLNNFISVKKLSEGEMDIGMKAEHVILLAVIADELKMIRKILAKDVENTQKARGNKNV